MSDIKAGQIWIRHNRNVQVRIWHDVTGDSVFFSYRGNNHDKTMGKDEFLRKFVELQPLLDEITEGSKWIGKFHGHSAKVIEVSKRSGIVYYTHENIANAYPKYGIEIGGFKAFFEPDLSEAV